MDRPASRGLLAGGVSKAPTGLAIDRPERPSTASRQQQPMQAATVQRMGTASTRGGAGAASGGGVLGPPPGTAFRRVLGGGAAGAQAQAADQAQARPLTAQQGIGLQKPMTAGSGRQVLDRTYFLNELRQKRQQVFNTISQMREELEVLEQKKVAAARADKLAGQLRKEVRLLQEGLADNNIIIDKAGSHTPLNQIHAEYADIKARNEAQHARVEDILAQRLAAEQQAKQAEAQMASIQATIDRRLSSMPPAARQAYAALQAEQGALLAEAARFEEESAELTAALSAAEGELSRSSLKQRALDVQEQIRLMTQRKVELTAAEEASKASAEEQKEALMARVRRDNVAVEQLTAEAKQLQGRVRQLEALQQAQGAAAGGAGAAAGSSKQDDAERRAKFEELRQKERELTSFIDAFPQRRAAKQAQMAAKQDAIVRLLQHLARLQGQQDGGAATGSGGSDGAGAAGSGGSPPTAQQSRMSLGAAAAAALAGGLGGGSPGGGVVGVGSELTGKRAELHKLQDLQAKIGEEVQALRVRMATMQAEVGTYGDIDTARGAKEAERAQLEGQQQELQQQCDAVKAELAQAKWAQQTHEAQLKGQPLWPAVDRLEGQLKQIQRQCALARDAIRAHQDAGHEVLLPQVLGLVEELNQAHIAAVMAV